MEMETCSVGVLLNFLQDQNVLEIGHTTTGMYLTLLNCTLKNSLDDEFYVYCMYHSLKNILKNKRL